MGFAGLRLGFLSSSARLGHGIPGPGRRGLVREDGQKSLQEARWSSRFRDFVQEGGGVSG